MRLIVTRPQREARRWVAELAAQGMEAVALPLIELGPVADQTALRQVGQQLGDYASVMFVSAAAVEHFFAADAAMAALFAMPGGGGVRAWATGPGTSAALRGAGVALEQIDAPPPLSLQFDSEALWQRVGVQVRAGDRVLIVRGVEGGKEPEPNGGSGRDWLAQQLASVGARVDFVVAYQRQAPAFGAAESELAQRAASDGSVWLFSSSQALRHLSCCLPAQSWRKARALATHPRIAAVAKELGFGVVCESRPTLPDVMAALKSCHEF